MSWSTVDRLRWIRYCPQMKTKTIQSSQFPESLWQELAEVANGSLALEVACEGKIMAVLISPRFAAVADAPESASFWDASAKALLQRTSHFRLGQMPGREER